MPKGRLKEEGSKERFQRKVPKKGSKRKVQKEGLEGRFQEEGSKGGSRRKVPKDISGTFYEVRCHRPYLASPDT
jgi:hypothetical protein